MAIKDEILKKNCRTEALNKVNGLGLLSEEEQINIGRMSQKRYEELKAIAYDEFFDDDDED